MTLLASSIVWGTLVFWLILRAFGQRGALPPLREAAGERARLPCVTVIVPARDEADNIGRCLASLLAQDYPAGRLDIIVVNDDSRDATAAIVQRFSDNHRRVALLASPPLPPAWKGKVNACCAGAHAASPASEWLCFLDADMRAEPALLRSAVIAVGDNRLDLLTLAPRQDLQSFAERLIIPCGLYMLSFSQDLKKIQAAGSNDVVATGQFMLIRREAYERLGGFGVVCTSVVEDLEFARLLKRSGGRVLMQDGSGVLSTRMYTGWQTLWPGVAKNLVDMAGGPRRLVVLAVAALALSWTAVLLPVFTASACFASQHASCVSMIPAFAGSAAAFGLHLGGAAYFRIPIWYGLLFPLGYTAGALIAFDSLRWRLSGFVRWKGRVYR